MPHRVTNSPLCSVLPAGVLVSSIKLIAFHGCFSWITFRVMGLPLTYTVSGSCAWREGAWAASVQPHCLPCESQHSLQQKPGARSLFPICPPCLPRCDVCCRCLPHSLAPHPTRLPCSRRWPPLPVHCCPLCRHMRWRCPGVRCCLRRGACWPPCSSSPSTSWGTTLPTPSSWRWVTVAGSGPVLTLPWLQLGLVPIPPCVCGCRAEDGSVHMPGPDPPLQAAGCCAVCYFS